MANTATFVKTDAVTQGTWVGTPNVYGVDGGMLVGDNANEFGLIGPGAPAYVTPVVALAGKYSFNFASSDVRALQSWTTHSNRFEAVWYHAVGWTIDLPFTNVLQHQIALYCWAVGEAGRSQRIDVLDASNSNVLDTRTLDNFETLPKWLVWKVSGHVRLSLTNLAGSSAAVASGLFFDPVASPPIRPNSHGSPRFYLPRKRPRGES